jgi:hypothetical protein
LEQQGLALELALEQQGLALELALELALLQL